MQGRIASIEDYDDRTVKTEVLIDIHNGRVWHGAAIILYAEDQHEGARIGLAICDALDSMKDYVPRRIRNV